MVKEGKWQRGCRWGKAESVSKCMYKAKKGEMTESEEKERAKIHVITKLLHLRGVKRCAGLSFSHSVFPPPRLLCSSPLPVCCQEAERWAFNVFPISRHCDAFVLLYLPSPCPNFFVTPNFKLLKKSSSNLRKLKRLGGIYFIKWQFPAVAQHVVLPGSSGRQSFYARLRRMMSLVCDKQDGDIMSAAWGGSKCFWKCGKCK